MIFLITFYHFLKVCASSLPNAHFALVATLSPCIVGLGLVVF